jgi:hypothetical protein
MHRDCTLAVNIKVMICWGVECYTLVDGYLLYTSKVEVTGFLKKLVDTFQTAWHDTPEDHSYTETVEC